MYLINTVRNFTKAEIKKLVKSRQGEERGRESGRGGEGRRGV